MIAHQLCAALSFANSLVANISSFPVLMCLNYIGAVSALPVDILLRLDISLRFFNSVSG